MIFGFKYTAMTITGAFHLGIGALCFIISMMGYSTRVVKINGKHNLSLLVATPACIASLWTIMVGIFGILAGLKTNSEAQTKRMKVAYMTFAILCACIFSLGGISAFSAHASWTVAFGSGKNYRLFYFGSFAMFVEFVLSIVSSSICCCCSESKTGGVVVIQQNQPREIANSPVTAHYPPNAAYSNVAYPNVAYPNVAYPQMTPQVINEK
ncbi:uncharacterized protein LOC106868672 [Octopus bimaculoides]|uniref:Uncharacterized protein n=1 Tax=Octopus bimaculoides TaxID=37653 RepID=A0A0L8HTJ3_OCTBM|nr:uncharacterized protein LOC106868672 [Octopus bimaculoides]|eukprot:XP_014769533.1 PREDICTED: uncharacterized protein LOC106868672 [Octopus bimaculoides]